MAYRGRLAPTPSGFLHLGASTFWQAHLRARAAGGTLVLRQEDLDRPRCRPEFARAVLDDLQWLGLEWSEGPDVGGPYAPYIQSERTALYSSALERLQQQGAVYPCGCTRKDIREAQRAPNLGDEEPLYPGTCRDGLQPGVPVRSWRLRVPDGEAIRFLDGNLGSQCFVAGEDFTDFVVWKEGASYQLACAVDDAAMNISEVVRGADLLLSTARQLLIYAALGLTPPAFYHCALVTDAQGVRLAKRNDALSLRTLREQGCRPEDILAGLRGL
jgi:glutamyl/glutaminyl-tRNA synthetase